MLHRMCAQYVEGDGRESLCTGRRMRVQDRVLWLLLLAQWEALRLLEQIVLVCHGRKSGTVCCGRKAQEAFGWSLAVCSR